MQSCYFYNFLIKWNILYSHSYNVLESSSIISIFNEFAEDASAASNLTINNNIIGGGGNILMTNFMATNISNITVTNNSLY